MLVYDGGVILSDLYQDKEFWIAMGLAVKLVKFGWGQQFTGKGVFVGYLTGHFPAGLTAEVYHLSFLLFYPVFNEVLIVAGAGLVIGQGKALAKAAGIGVDLGVGAGDGSPKIAGFYGSMVQEIVAVDDIVYCQCVHLFSVLGFWGRAALGGATLEGIRVGGLAGVLGCCIVEEVVDGHTVKLGVCFHRLDLDEGHAHCFGGGGRNFFGVLGKVGVRFAVGKIEGDECFGSVKSEVGDLVDGDGAGDVLSHDGVSFSFV